MIKAESDLRIVLAPPAHQANLCSGCIEKTTSTILANKKNELVNRMVTHLLVNTLPAIFALLGVLDDGVTRKPGEDLGKQVEGDANHKKRYTLVDERPNSREESDLRNCR